MAASLTNCYFESVLMNQLAWFTTLVPKSNWSFSSMNNLNSGSLSCKSIMIQNVATNCKLHWRLHSCYFYCAFVFFLRFTMTWGCANNDRIFSAFFNVFSHKHLFQLFLRHSFFAQSLQLYTLAVIAFSGLLQVAVLHLKRLHWLQSPDHFLFRLHKTQQIEIYNR